VFLQTSSISSAVHTLIVGLLEHARPNTTMASFAMCADCQREIGNPSDRRFHAQPTACHAAGRRSNGSTRTESGWMVTPSGRRPIGWRAAPTVARIPASVVGGSPDSQILHPADTRVPPVNRHFI
jgi:hypothetical protein